MLKRFGLCAAALALATVGFASNVHAATVTFTTTGTFASSGTNVFSGAPGVTITFTGTPTTVLTPSNVTLGFFMTAGTTNTDPTLDLTDTFTLDIFQTVPGVGTGSYIGTLDGVLRINASTAYIDFGAPLTITIAGIRYELLEADGGVAGRTEIKPPSSAGGLSTVEARVTPEPASALLFGLGLLGSAAAARRRKARS
jgi:hypothetical protein